MYNGFLLMPNLKNKRCYVKTHRKALQPLNTRMRNYIKTNNYALNTFKDRQSDTKHFVKELDVNLRQTVGIKNTCIGR